MKQHKMKDKSDFIFCTWVDVRDINSKITPRKIAILKSDILRVWENDNNVNIYLKSKNNDSQRYITVEKTNIFEQLY